MSTKTEHNAVIEDVKQEYLDTGAEHVDGLSSQPAPHEDEMRAVRWKIDMRLLPIMVGTYGLQFYGLC